MACGSTDGNVYAFLRPLNPSAKNQKVYVNSMQKLEQLCSRDLNVNVTSLTNESDER